MKTTLAALLFFLLTTGSAFDAKAAAAEDCPDEGPPPTPLYQGIGTCPEHERDDIKKGILRMAGMRETIYGDGTLVAVEADLNWETDANIRGVYETLFWMANMEKKLGSPKLINEMKSYSYDDLRDDINDMRDPEGDEHTIKIVDGFRGKYMKLTDRGWESFIISGREEAAIREVIWKLAYDLYTNNGATKYKHLYNYAYATGGSRVHPEYYRLFIIDYLYGRGYLDYDSFWNNRPPNEDERVMTLTDDGHIWFANNIGGENLVARGTRWDWRWLTKNHKNFKEGVAALDNIWDEGARSFFVGAFVHHFPGYTIQQTPVNTWDSFDFLRNIGFIDISKNNGDIGINKYKYGPAYESYRRWANDQ